MRLARHGALGENLIELRLKLLLQDDAITRGGVKALHQGLHRLHPLGGLGVGRPGLAAVQLHHGRCPGLAVFGMFMPCVVGMIMRRTGLRAGHQDCEGQQEIQVLLHGFRSTARRVAGDRTK